MMAFSREVDGSLSEAELRPSAEDKFVLFDCYAQAISFSYTITRFMYGFQHDFHVLHAQRRHTAPLL